MTFTSSWTGAAETVAPSSRLGHIATNKGQKFGTVYKGIEGSTVTNVGEKALRGYVGRHVVKLTAQVCDVNKALLSVHKMVAAGNRVVFDKEGSYIEHTGSKEKLWMTEQGGMYMLRLWVKTGF